MKKILHAMLDCFYKDGFGYQENILPAKHKQMGFEVYIITYNQGRHASCNALAPVTYMNSDDIPVHVLGSNRNILSRIPIVVGWVDSTIGLYDLLEKIRPDIIFIHGICIHDNLHFVAYKHSHPEVKIFVDNHSDYYNTPIKKLKNKIYRYGVGGYVGKRLGAIAEKVWGVTPWRVDYMKEVYGVPPSKTGLLVMGGDEDKICWAERNQIRNDIRKSLSISSNAFLVVTGGKIDEAKNIHLLVEAIRSISDNSRIETLSMTNVHLLIFGKIESDMQDFFARYEKADDAASENNIHYIGWIPADKAYDYFLASDLACFPGTHSVLWEQACACGLPAIFKDWGGGFSHVDVGGNCTLLKDISMPAIRDCIVHIMSDKQLYGRMKEIAETKARKVFSYMNIARKSINFIEP